MPGMCVVLANITPIMCVVYARSRSDNARESNQLPTYPHFPLTTKSNSTTNEPVMSPDRVGVQMGWK